MNALLATASALCTIGVLWHGIGGELGIVRRLDPAKLEQSPFGDNEITKRVLRACWHLVTVTFAVDACALAMMAMDPTNAARAALAWSVALQFAGFLLVYLVIALPRPIVFVRAPQWLFFTAVAVLAYLGAS